MASVVYNTAKHRLGTGALNWPADATIKVGLTTSAYSPNPDHAFKSEITNELPASGNYVVKSLANKQAIKDDATDRAIYDADDVSWANATFTARGAFIFQDTGVAATSPLIAYVDFGVDKTASGGAFDIIWDAAGVFYIAQGA
jgi:hypothetical protein